jgi:hypothetical protein
MVIVDARAPTDEPLRAIVACAAVHHDVQLVACAERALDAVSAAPPAAVLLEAQLDHRSGSPALGPLIASICHGRLPGVPLLLYVGDTRAAHERELAQMGLRLPVVLEQRLAESFDSIVAELVEYTGGIELLCRGREGETRSSSDRLPDSFRIERYLVEVEAALMRASLNEHADRTRAAAAVCMPFGTFVDRLAQHAIELPRDPRPRSVSGPRILWCSDVAAPPCVSAACDEEGLAIRAVRPGTLHPDSVLSLATIAGVVTPVDPATAVDAWLLHRSVRPILMAGTVPTPVDFLHEELGVHRCGTSSDLRVPAALLRMGRCAANLYRDEQLGRRLPYGPDGVPAWPRDLPELLRRLDGLLLRFARRTSVSQGEAASAVGLSERTFRRRLHAVDRCDPLR